MLNLSITHWIKLTLISVYRSCGGTCSPAAVVRVICSVNVINGADCRPVVNEVASRCCALHAVIAECLSVSACVNQIVNSFHNWIPPKYVSVVKRYCFPYCSYIIHHFSWFVNRFIKIYSKKYVQKFSTFIQKFIQYHNSNLTIN